MLLTTDMDFGTITDEEGKVVPLTISNFSTYLQSSNQSVRKEAFEKIYKANINISESLLDSLSLSSYLSIASL